jgi:hypothetical protein
MLDVDPALRRMRSLNGVGTPLAQCHNAARITAKPYFSEDELWDFEADSLLLSSAQHSLGGVRRGC